MRAAPALPPSALRPAFAPELVTPKREFELAFAVVVAGTLGVLLSAATGDAARDAASPAPRIAAAIAEHEDLGSFVRAAFSVLALLLALVLHLVALLPLYNAAHSGAVLVHKLGVHARL